MENSLKTTLNLRADLAQKALEKNNMQVFRAKDKAEVRQIVKGILKKATSYRTEALLRLDSAAYTSF